MVFRFSRRRMMQGVGSAALAQSLETVKAAPAPRTWPILEGPDTPKICLSAGDAGGPLPAGVVFPAAGAGGRGGGGRGGAAAGGAAPGAAGAPGAGAAAGRGGRGGGGYGGFLAPSAAPAPAPAPAQEGGRATMIPADAAGRGGRGGFGGSSFANAQRILQLGVTHLLGVSIGGNPWTEENVRRVVDSAKAAGLVAYNSMMGIPNSIIYGRDTQGQGHGDGDRIHRGRRQRRAAGDRVQLLRAPRHRRLLRDRRQSQGGLHGFRLRSRIAGGRVRNAWWGRSTATRKGRSRPKPWPRSPTPRR